jgi:hypothetical protein
VSNDATVHTLQEIVEEPEVPDCAEDDDEAALSVPPSESSVSTHGSVVHNTSLRDGRSSYHRRPWRRPAAMHVAIPPHVHIENNIHWCGMLLVGSTIDLRRSTRLSSGYVGCLECDSDSEEDHRDHEAY